MLLVKHQIKIQFTKKISSSYVHTYGKVTVTPSLNSSGTVSFSLSNTSYAWTIASSVSANF